MTDQPRTRQEIYDRIRTTSKDEYILEEMIRLGFWESDRQMPEDPAADIRRRGEIQRELQTLRQENRRLNDEAALKRAALQQRMAAARQKRQETKERREQQRQAKAAAWADRQSQSISYLGPEVSQGLNRTASNLERLQEHRLPVFQDSAELAAAMGISLGQLRFLAFSRRVSTVSHYVRFHIPKKTGGIRAISAPLPRLKQAQQWILDNILDRVALHSSAHGFRRGRSIVTNAQPHIGSAALINLDLQDFFPTISYRRIKGVFIALGYAEAIATILGLLCTEPDITAVELDSRKYYIAEGSRYLPQGAPSSPALTNILCRRLDQRLDGLAQQRGFTYTRYADDLSFSTPDVDNLRNIGNILQGTRAIVAHEGFTIHPDKTRVLRPSQHQEVTGIVVNEKLNIDRATIHKFRATLHQIAKDGPAGKSWGTGEDVLLAIEGYANYVAMVNPTLGQKFLSQVKNIKKTYGRRSR
jgi:RNA-directed DNA polymerase